MKKEKANLKKISYSQLSF